MLLENTREKKNWKFTWTPAGLSARSGGAQKAEQEERRVEVAPPVEPGGCWRWREAERASIGTESNKRVLGFG